MSQSHVKLWYLVVDDNGVSIDKYGALFGLRVPLDTEDLADLRKLITADIGYKFQKDVPLISVHLFKDITEFEKRNPLNPGLSLSQLADCGRSYDNPLLICWSRYESQVAESDLAKVVDSISAPSSFSKYKGKGSWVDVFTNKTRNIICHRQQSEASVPPVSILCKQFADFVVDLDSIAVDGKDCMFVYKLCYFMGGSFIDKQARQEKFSSLFYEYTGYALHRMYVEQSLSDGSLNWQGGPLYCNMAVAVEKGQGGGDPYMQGLAFYIKSLSDIVQNRQSQVNQYPCLHIELCGTLLSVNGVVNTDTKVICDPLGPSYQLLCNPKEHTVIKIARMFAATKKYLQNANQHYQQSILATQFPFPKQAVDGNDVLFEFEYKKEMYPMMYEAQIKGTDTIIIVKFCTKYNEEIHRFCHQHGFAPQLFSGSRMGHYYMVVMEKLDMRRIRFDDRKNSTFITQAKHIISTLQQKGYVHGDMRETNLLIRTDIEQLVLIDYDWAGVHGVSVYAPFLNMDEISWPPGVEPGKPMLMEHDECLMRRLFNVD
ncbi:hypothetical protein MIR68_002733 [Amoeboaphelidium protococcarum]|nr:hypothetical protein MIR68_002733 [Amoeboaphelidium protococcarum]